MNVYIITNESFPYGMAATNRIICYAKAIHHIGIYCEVVVFHRTEIYGQKVKNTKGIGIFEGIPYRYIGGTPLRDRNPVLRKYHDWRDQDKTLDYLNKKLSSEDIVLLYSGGNIDFSLKLIDVVKKRRAHIVRDLCEFPYGTGFETESIIRKRHDILEKQFSRLDGFICISNSLMNLAKSYGSSRARFVKVPIMVDYENYYMENSSSDTSIPFIFHSGTLYEQKDGILGMIEAFGKALSKLKHPVNFVSTGLLEKSPHKKEIELLVQRYNLGDKLIFTGYLSHDELKEKLSKASLVIINKYYTQQNCFCFSTKLGEYLAASKPVIITRIGEAMNYLENGKNAIIVEPEDNDALADAIVRSFNFEKELSLIGKNGQTICKNNFTYEVQGRVLKDFFISFHTN